MGEKKTKNPPKLPEPKPLKLVKGSLDPRKIREGQ